MYVRGKYVILLIGALAIAAASFTVWFNVRQSAKMIATWSRPTAELILNAPQAEILELVSLDNLSVLLNDPTAKKEVIRAIADSYVVKSRKDVVHARGFLNLRRALIEDRAFQWDETKQGQLSENDRQFGLEFRDGEKHATLVIDLYSGRIWLVGSDATARLLDEGVHEFSLFFQEQIPARDK
jgi:hypothetical protein